MRKVDMKRKSRQEKASLAAKESDEERASNKEANSENDSENSEPEEKKTKSERRKSSGLKKKNRNEQHSDDENGVEGKDSDDESKNDVKDAEDSASEDTVGKKKKGGRKKNDVKKNKKGKTAARKSDIKDEEPGDDQNGDSEDIADDKRKKDKKGSVVKKTKKDKEEDVGDEEEDEEQYEVEAVLEEKVIRGVRHYLIRWKGYEPESDTWEPESTLQCADLIKKFKNSKNDGNDTSKMKKSKKDRKPEAKKDDKTPDWDENDEFEVDRILDVYFKRNGQREFLVHWKGYPNADNSWEPEENLECKDLINKFLLKVDRAKEAGVKELRVNRPPTERFTLATRDTGRRISRRNVGKQRVHYHEAE